MLQLFRNLTKSRLGVGVTLVFLAIMALAFVGGDVANSNLFGGVAGGDRVATVGDERVDSADLISNATNALEAERQENPSLTMPAFIAQGGLTQVLDQLLSRTALSVFGQEHGLKVSDRLIDSELLQIGAFRGADGQFDANLFRATLAQRGLTEAAVREDLAAGLYARQLLSPVALSPVMPASFGPRYAALLRERRQGAIALIPSDAYAPTAAPTDAQLQAFYRETSSSYIRPERRVLRFVTFGEDALAGLPAPTEAQIAQRFQRDRAQYGASERRRFTQLIVPTQAAAQAIVNEVRGGTSLAASAQGKGLRTAGIGPVTQSQLTSQASTAVASAAFGAAQGAIAAPARGPLGWYVLQVDGIERTAARTLDQVRGEIAQTLATEARTAAIAGLGARVQDQLDDGATLAEVATSVKGTVTTTRPATAEGSIYGSTSNERVPEELTRVLPSAFEMAEGEAQVAEVVPGERFVAYDVAEITPSATAPLAEIRDEVVALWRRDQGAAAARAAAQRVQQRIGKGATLAAALAAEDKGLPAPRTVNLTRDQLAGQQQVPRPLALFFSMAKGTTKTLEEQGDGGWYVVQLADVQAPAIAQTDPLVLASLQQLGTATGEEYVQQFLAAVEAEVGVERNADAIAGVTARLTGGQ
ncbi:peptidylprolyl isomerase [Croceibacterium ferulae]|uniref:peptidylprolyl isomerase n=1 Tax=Croceibacterium ferulae TaxID=1854641 RepID=UPI00138FBB46|nr:peptidylprolyl isomerase [Croceibacterium ferulae]